MHEDVTRVSLLSRVRDPADHDAWVQFEARYRELILRYALSRGLQHADAEDVRQIVMMSLSAALRNFSYAPQRGRFRNYLGRVVRNAVSRMQGRPRSGTNALDTDVEACADPGESGPDAIWEQEWVGHHYRLALGSLRETFEPASVEVFEQLAAGKSVAETAEARGLSIQAVHKIKQRIRNRMKELIAAQIRDEEEPDEATSG